jgi:hypothetical protein
MRDSILEIVFIALKVICMVQIVHGCVVFGTAVRFDSLYVTIGNGCLIAVPCLGLLGSYKNWRVIVFFFALIEVALAVLCLIYLDYCIKVYERCSEQRNSRSTDRCSYEEYASSIRMIALISYTSLLLVLSAVFSVFYALLMPKIATWRRARNLFLRSKEDRALTMQGMLHKTATVLKRNFTGEKSPRKGSSKKGTNSPHSPSSPTFPDTPSASKASQEVEMIPVTSSLNLVQNSTASDLDSASSPPVVTQGDASLSSLHLVPTESMLVPAETKD